MADMDVNNGDEREGEILEGLTPYDHHRKPLKPTDDPNHETTIQAQRINKELTCPICLGLLKETMTTMDCMHRFCSECINKSLRVGNRECPTCRMKCASRRALRADPLVDQMISLLYPDVNAWEDYQDEVVESLNAQHVEAFQRSMKLGLERQENHKKMHRGPVKKIVETPTAAAQENRGQRRKNSDDESDERPPAKKAKTSVGARPTMPAKPKAPILKKGVSKKAAATTPSMPARKPAAVSPVSTPQPLSHRFSPGDNMTIELVLHPREKHLIPLKKPFLTTSVGCTVEHLCRYLAMKLDGRNSSMFKLSVYVENIPCVLSREQSLEQIWHSFWNREQYMSLQYSVRSTGLE